MSFAQVVATTWQTKPDIYPVRLRIILHRNSDDWCASNGQHKMNRTDEWWWINAFWITFFFRMVSCFFSFWSFPISNQLDFPGPINIPHRKHWIILVLIKPNFSLHFQGKAHGRRSAIYLRSLYQSHLQTLGIYVDKNAGKLLFVAAIVLGAFCVLLKTATITTEINQLWIQSKLLRHTK